MTDEASLMVHQVRAQGGRDRRFWSIAAVVTAVVVGAAVFVFRTDGHGDPDPGGRLLAALRPVASAVPAGVSNIRRQFSEPIWDSCDGRSTTSGWDDVTVDVSFNSHGLSDSAVLTHLRTALSSDGWTYDRASNPGAWYWNRNLTHGRHASIQLLGGSHVRPHNPWDLQATTPAVTHPIKDC